MKIEVRTRGFRPTPALRAYTDSRLRFAVGRFPHEVSEVRVSLSGVNGPRGGSDKRCSLRARLRASGQAAAHAVAADFYAAIALAAHQLGRSVARTLERRRPGRSSIRVAAPGPEHP
jgi:ribosomal subunit interface protein